MEFFLDTADVDSIRELSETGLIDGVTTNPSLVAKSGKDFFTILKDISKIVSGPISAEVTALESNGMIAEGEKLAKIAKNIVIKLPLTQEGLKACKKLTKKKIKTNVTLCFSPAQALIAAKSGATYISPFVGRLDDIGENGMELIQKIKDIYSNYPKLNTKILVASVRNMEHVAQAAIIGADVVTLPPKILEELYEHPLTKKGLDAFMEDWKKTNQKII
jgi:transaldolase|tara:strand:- start:607 stop:1263 length:657 start_codon:yes stop_codon:yes gene_type:complete